jgi:hypothetical protein
MKKIDHIYQTPKDSPVVPSPFDKRVRLRNLTRGVVSKTEVDAHLKTLPDETSHADFRDYEKLVKSEDDSSRSNGSGTTTH